MWHLIFIHTLPPGPNQRCFSMHWWNSWYCPVGIPSAPALPSPPPPAALSSGGGSYTNTCYQSSSCNNVCPSSYTCTYNPGGAACGPTPYNYECDVSPGSCWSGGSFTTTGSIVTCPPGTSWQQTAAQTGSCVGYPWQCATPSPPPLTSLPPPPRSYNPLTASPPPPSNVVASCYTTTVNFGIAPTSTTPLASSTFVCIRYCYACSMQSPGSTVCTSSETAAAVTKVIYDESDTGTAASLSASFASVYGAQYNFYSCNSNLCNYNSAISCPARSLTPQLAPSSTPGTGNMYGSPSMARSATDLLQPVVAVSVVLFAVEWGM